MDTTNIESTSLLRDQFLSLLRWGIDKESEPLQGTVNWDAVETMAVKHGLLAVVYDAIPQLPKGQRPPQVMWLRWIGQVMQGYEARHEAYRKAVMDLAAFYNTHGYKMMLLKGDACGRDWPRPEHRPCGDIDIWLFGKQKEADDVLVREKGIKIDNSHHHHTVFSWMGFTVENHYDFVNVHARKSNAELEKVFKEFGEDDSHSVEVKGDDSTGSATKVYLPSPNLHALFLIRHMVGHFAAAEITLRQVLDWAFFVEKHTNEMDWEWLDGMLVKYHMREFFSCINAICVEDLGFQPVESLKFRVESQLESAEFRKLKERVLSDILEPAFTAETPKPLIPRVIFKYRRWKGNSWKHELCYGTSRWDGFWMLLRSHLMKPKVS